MQSISVYLYPNKLDVFTSSLATWQPERYRRVYNRNLKIYRGVDNRIDVQVRNSDQKKEDLGNNSSMVFNLIGATTQNLILQKTCVIVDASIGRAYVILTESELLGLEEGYYNYSIHQVTNGSKTPLYIDAQYGALSTLEISGDIAGSVQPVLEVTKFAYYNPATTGDLNAKYYISSLIDGRADLATPASLHTFQLYFTDFTGNVVIQGSLSESSTPATWADLDSVNYANATTDYRNITGKYNWFRIKFTPESTISSPGTLDKVLYR